MNSTLKYCQVRFKWEILYIKATYHTVAVGDILANFI